MNITEEYDLIINRFHAAIIESGFSYRELEEKTGIPRATIQRWATGQKKDLPMEGIKTVCKAIGYDVKTILGWDTEKTVSAETVKESVLIESFRKLNGDKQDYVIASIKGLIQD